MPFGNWWIPDSDRPKSYEQDRLTPKSGQQETEIFQQPLRFCNGLRITYWHHLECLAP